MALTAKLNSANWAFHLSSIILSLNTMFKKDLGIIKVYIRKLFKLKNNGKKEYLCLLSICTANLNGINNMNHIQTLFKVFSIDNCLSM